MPEPKDAKSPCINVCRLDETNRYCVGCFRTKDEILRWTRVTDEDREMIKVLAKNRKERADAGTKRHH